MALPAQPTRLVDQFRHNLAVLKSHGYNGIQVRVEFIDQLFPLVGWDVHNSAGCTEQRKAVVHEDTIRVGGATKMPDYCFRIGGVRKSLLEAKTPSVNIMGTSAREES